MKKDVFFGTGEKAINEMRALYESYGYKKYKMRKFEEYDLYLENKSFLATDSIITFTDLNGKLLALKPDVTLSIAKNVKLKGHDAQKLYYTENVYRESRAGNEYKEIMQVGLEYIGDIDLCVLCEVISLAAKSLHKISDNYVMDISHVGFASGLLDETDLKQSAKAEVLKMLSQKDAHSIAALCEKENVKAELSEKLIALPSVYGSFKETLKAAEKLVVNDKMREALSELKGIYSVLKNEKSAKNLRLDFSITNDLSYYNGIIFQGFIDGVPCDILSGGRYDNLMQKLGTPAQAIGFAVYIDLLERYFKDSAETDVDVLLTYTDKDDTAAVLKAADKIRKSGKSVRVQTSGNTKIKYGEKIVFEGGAENA